MINKFYVNRPIAHVSDGDFEYELSSLIKVLEGLGDCEHDNGVMMVIKDKKLADYLVEWGIAFENVHGMYMVKNDDIRVKKLEALYDIEDREDDDFYIRG